MRKFSVNLVKPILLLASCVMLPSTVKGEHIKSDTHDLPPADGTQSADTPVKTPNEFTFTREPTDEEALLNLNRRLNGLLQDFDDMLLKEEAILTERKNASGSDSITDLGDDEIDGQGNGGDGTSENDVSEIREQGATEGETAESGSGIQADSGGGKGPVPGANDDDVVARQLREAAEKETDPVLKKKLWDEYRNYKKQQ